MSVALLRVGQMAEADRLAIAAGTPASLLMQNAGEAVAREIQRRFTPRAVSVLCGPGNNGGDGFVAATALAQAGWPVRVALLGELETLRNEAQYHARRWRGAVEALTPAAIEGAALVIDALFGSGLNRALDPKVSDVLRYATRRALPIVAVDIPSGILGDSGENIGAAPAVCTVTFMRKKPGHLLLPGRDACGDVVVADIGIPQERARHGRPSIPGRTRRRCGMQSCRSGMRSINKYGRGHALLYGGYPMTGAARMAARAAARIGAGLTTIAVPERRVRDLCGGAHQHHGRGRSRQHGDFSRLLDDARFTRMFHRSGRGRQRHHAPAHIGHAR